MEVSAQLRELVNQKLQNKNPVSHNDIEDVLIEFYESQGLTEVSVDDDEIHEAVTELWADFDDRGRATP